MICILAIPHVGALLLFKNSWIISFCLLQTGLMDDRQRQVNGSFWDRSDRDRDRVFWLSDSFTTVCSQLKRALLSAPVHPSFSSIPISSCLPCCFSIIPSTWGPVRIGSIHDSLQPSLNLLLSKSIHCSASASCQSRPIGWPERQLDRQVQSSIYLSFSLCQPADSLPQRRAFGHQLTKVSKKAGITEKSLSPSVTKNMVLLISLDIRVSSPGGYVGDGGTGLLDSLGLTEILLMFPSGFTLGIFVFCENPEPAPSAAEMTAVCYLPCMNSDCPCGSTAKPASLYI